MRRAHGVVLLSGMANGSKLAGKISRSSWILQLRAKKMLPIAVAAAIWGKEWRGCTIEFNCDNEAVVHSFMAGSCKEKNMAHMLRCLFFIEAKFNLALYHLMYLVSSMYK